VRAWQAGVPLLIRNPQAIRPWQYVLEPLAGYLTLAQKLWAQPELAGAFNFGPHTHEAATVENVIKLACSAYGTGVTSYENNNSQVHEASWRWKPLVRAWCWGCSRAGGWPSRWRAAWPGTAV